MEKSAVSGGSLLHGLKRKEQAVNRSKAKASMNPKVVIEEQSNQIQDLRRAVQAMEGKLDETRHSEALFPPIRGVEG